jgi:hypothetical protein
MGRRKARVDVVFSRQSAVKYEWFTNNAEDYLTMRLMNIIIVSNLFWGDKLVKLSNVQYERHLYQINCSQKHISVILCTTHIHILCNFFVELYCIRRIFSNIILPSEPLLCWEIQIYLQLWVHRLGRGCVSWQSTTICRSCSTCSSVNLSSLSSTIWNIQFI